MNNLDKQYQQLLQDIIDFGVEKKDRTGTGTKSIFGYTIRHNMSEGFPLLTTKKMAWKSIVTELLWFLSGDTNIKFLVDNNCNIWNGDAYKNYLKKHKDNLIGCTIVLSNGVSAEIKAQHNVNRNVLITTKGCINIEGDKTIKILNDTLTQEEFINKIKTDDEFAKKWGKLGPIYGKQWRRWTKKKMYLSTDGSNENIYDEADQTVIDQISILINDLKTNPDSRRMMVNAWNVGELDQMVLPPCHYGFQVYTRELSSDERYNLLSESEKKNFIIAMRPMMSPDDKYDEVHYTIDNYYEHIPKRAISLMWNQRSVDTFLGLPFNIASYGLLLEIIAKVVDMVPDELIGNLGDTHLYLNHIEQAKEQISRDSFDLPKLNLNTEFWQTESKECGVGPLSASGFVSSLADIYFCKCLLEEDIQLSNYQSHPSIKAPLSN
jgi:thymidylate synthase